MEIYGINYVERGLPGQIDFSEDNVPLSLYST